MPVALTALRSVVLGLALIELPPVPCRTLLDITSREVEINCRAWRHWTKSTLYSFTVREVAACDPGNPQKAVPAKTSRSYSDMFELAAECVESLLPIVCFQPGGYGGAGIPAIELLSQWRQLPDYLPLQQDGQHIEATQAAFMQWTVVGLQLPGPIVLALVVGVWPGVCFPYTERNHVGRGLLQHLQRVEAPAPQPWPWGDCDPAQRDVDPEICRKLCFCVAKHRGQLAANENNVALEDTVAGVEGMLHLAYQGIYVLSGEVDWAAPTKRGPYQIITLLRFFWLSHMLRSADSLRDAVVKAIDAIWPRAFAERVKSMLESEGKRIPTGPTLHRMRFIIDAGYMLWFRDHIATSSDEWRCYMLADASPKNGREWLLAEMCYYSLPMLSNAVRAADSIVIARGSQSVRPLGHCWRKSASTRISSWRPTSTICSLRWALAHASPTSFTRWPV